MPVMSAAMMTVPAAGMINCLDLLLISANIFLQKNNPNDYKDNTENVGIQMKQYSENDENAPPARLPGRAAIMISDVHQCLFPMISSESSITVNGPSFTRLTFISAPNTPFSTTGTRSFAFSIM